MNVDVVLSMVCRDRAVEALRSRHAMLRRAGRQYLRAARCAFPAPVAYSSRLFDLEILSRLKRESVAAIDRGYLELLGEIHESTAYEFLSRICAGRKPYIDARHAIGKTVCAACSYPTLPQLDQLMMSTAIQFELSRLQFERSADADKADLWERQRTGIQPALKALEFAQRQMDAAVAHAQDLRDAMMARRRRQGLAALAGLLGLGLIVAAARGVGWPV